PKGRYALSGPELQLWDVTTGRVVGGRRPGRPAVYDPQQAANSILEASLGEAILSLAFSPDGRYFASGNHWANKPLHGTEVQINDIVLWDVSTWKEVRRFTGHNGKVTALAFTPDGRYI